VYPKPKGFNNVGLIQCFLAAFFVLWFFIFPKQGIYFAWPVKPELTAMFIGAGFILRSYFGYHLWRDKYWYTLRWSLKGDYAFLATLFVTTWWHISEMNWDLQGVSDGLRIFSLTIAHVWMLAYTFEPITVFLLHPRDPEADAPLPENLMEGAPLPILKNALLAVFYVSVGFWAVLFFTPEFANTRWPWELNAFDSRIMAAWFAGCAVWSVTMYFMKDWAEIKIGVRSILFFVVGLFAISVIAFPFFELNHTEIASRQAPVFQLATGLMSAWLLYAYWKQEQVQQKPQASLSTPKEEPMTTIDWNTVSFKVDIAHMLADCSKIVYEDKSEFNGVLEKYGMKDSQFFDKEDTQALVAHNDSAIIIAFRGTSSVEDALTDAKIKLIQDPGTKGKIHEGFKTGLDKVWLDIWNTVGRIRVHDKRPIWLTGHSLGGALALTAAARLRFEKNVIINGLYTFGQPRVGDLAYVKACNRAFGLQYFRFVHNNDIVPRVPMRVMGFEHTGFFKYINKDLKLDSSLTWAQITRDRLDGRLDNILGSATDGIKDHSMINYLNALSK